MLTVLQQDESERAKEWAVLQAEQAGQDAHCSSHALLAVKMITEKLMR